MIYTVSMEQAARNLVLAAGSLGDSLMTLPALHILQSRSSLTVAGTFPYQALGKDLLGVDQVVALEPLLQNLLTAGEMDPETGNFLSDFREVFLFFKDRDEAVIKRFSAMKNLQIHNPVKPFAEFLGEARWVGEYWLETVLKSSLPGDSPLRQPRLCVGPELQARGLEILESLGLPSPLIIHPGSGSPKKNAPLSFFRSAAERTVTESQKPVLVVWGEAEEENLDSIRQAFAGMKNVQVLPRQLPLTDLAAVFSKSLAYLGNDSGVTQLAAACGLKTFAVFHSTDSRIWGPQANAFIYHWIDENLR